MEQKKGFTSFLKGLGLVKDDVGGSSAETTKDSVSGSSPPAKPFFVSPSPTSGGEDAARVEALKTSVLNTSPIIAQFMQNFELVKGTIQNDDTACVKAALAVTRVSKVALIEELDRTVAAAFLHAKKSADNDRTKSRDSTVGVFEKDLQTAKEEVHKLEASIAEMQQALAQKKTTEVDLQKKIRDAEANLLRQDEKIKALFSEVEQFIDSLRKTFSVL